MITDFQYITWLFWFNLFIFAFLAVSLWKTYKNIMVYLTDIEDRSIIRHTLLEDWLFKSLYSINHKVLLPEEKEKPAISKPARVYNPIKDPMSEFTADRADFLQGD